MIAHDQAFTPRHLAGFLRDDRERLITGQPAPLYLRAIRAGFMAIGGLTFAGLTWAALTFPDFL